MLIGRAAFRGDTLSDTLAAIIEREPDWKPDAIEASWLPFLIDPGTTMVLTCVDVRPAVSGDGGTTTGTLAVTGRTNQGVQTVPLGTYVIEWTMVDGQWKIRTLGGTLGRKPPGSRRPSSAPSMTERADLWWKIFSRSTL